MKTEYLAIGKVAKLKNISIKALRYYDEIGIFRPAYINPQTNYRYYTKEQLPLLDAVSLCLQLGIPLKTLPAYVKNEQFDFNTLLSDTRKLAEEKIHGIRLALDKIEFSCNRTESSSSISHTESSDSISHTEPALAAADIRASELSLPVTFPQDEYLLALPLPVEQLPPFDGFVLKLFIFARQKNVVLDNPSCMLYRYEDSCWQRYLCLRLNPTVTFSPDVLAQVLRNCEFSLFKIPTGEYRKHLRKTSIEPPSPKAFSTFGNFPKGLAASLLERRLNDTALEAKYPFELIQLTTYDFKKK